MWYLLGKAYFKKGRVEEALMCVDKSIKAFSQSQKVHDLRDEILTYMKEKNEK